ncbi:hypothetical protein [Paramaledivibacter caminithermalis]|jgi:DNA repair exonuclease SbcCD ATPase subunit|uniref:Uncharacterized protein n=1 Tax=Paramaledivibacter caminithermalis (strain DSM 15212 / CIP 107654 / DViRD3) TaxID=1121301 RepID=A0A1M6JMI5_PARC5|nr:hypothetical protein [Paramaledivibacter caminithermalis]SHJ47882.1 hypothetical protein SAMN02745912_00047 [Paramaledivibacter caminithermalis DSM 15212]
MLDKKINNLLKPLKLKYFLKRMIHINTMALMIWGGVSFVLMVASRFFPITFIWNKILLALGISLVSGFFWSFCNKPSYKETARLVDSFGLKERTLTALELKGDDSLVSRIQKEDTLKILEKEDYRSKISLKPSMKILLFLLIIIVATIGISFIPTKSYVLAKEREKNIEKLEVEKANIEKVKEKIKKDESLTSEEKKKLEEKIDKIKRTLEKPKEFKNAQKEIVKFKKELNKINEDIKQRKIDEIAKKIEAKSFTKNLAEKLKKRNSHEVAKEIEKMANKLKNSNQDELKKISKQLKEIQELLKNNPELAKAFKEVRDALAKSIQQGMANSDALNKSLENLNQNINDMLNNPQLSSQLNEVMGSISELNNTLDEISGNNNEVLNNNNGSKNEGSGNNQEVCPTGEHSGEGG